MLYVHERMAELYLIQKRVGELTGEQEKEMEHCLAVNELYVHKHHVISNKSEVAFAMNDFAWMHELCREAEALELNYRMKKVK